MRRTTLKKKSTWNNKIIQVKIFFLKLTKKHNPINKKTISQNKQNDSTKTTCHTHPQTIKKEYPSPPNKDKPNIRRKRLFLFKFTLNFQMFKIYYTFEINNFFSNKQARQQKTNQHTHLTSQKTKQGSP